MQFFWKHASSSAGVTDRQWLSRTNYRLRALAGLPGRLMFCEEIVCARVTLSCWESGLPSTSVLCVRDWEHDGAKLRILWTSCSEIIIVYLLSPAWKLNQAYSGKSPLNSRTRPAKAEDQQQTTSL